MHDNSPFSLASDGAHPLPYAFAWKGIASGFHQLEDLGGLAFAFAVAGDVESATYGMTKARDVLNGSVASWDRDGDGVKWPEIDQPFRSLCSLYVAEIEHAADDIATDRDPDEKSAALALAVTEAAENLTDVARVSYAARGRTGYRLVEHERV